MVKVICDFCFTRMIHCQRDQGQQVTSIYTKSCVVIASCQARTGLFTHSGLRNPMERKKISQSNEKISTRSTLH